MSKKKKIQIPTSVLDLRLSVKKFAKKNGIRLKGLKKSEKKRNLKKLKSLYSKSTITGLDKAIKIISENPQVENKKIEKVKEAIENIIVNSELMNKIAKLYKKDPDNYPNMLFLPHMIINTLLYYSQEDLNENDKSIAATLDKDMLMDFCQKILKKIIKRYEKFNLDPAVAFKLAEIIPTNKLLVNNRQWYKKLIQSLYNIAETVEVDFETILKAVLNVDKKKHVKKNDLYYRFFSEFILTKSSNKNHSFTETQKDLHETLIEKTLSFMESQKSNKIRKMLKEYIRRRRTAEEYKNDGKRVIKFLDYATNNSPFAKLKTVIHDLISENTTNELYLG